MSVSVVIPVFNDTSALGELVQRLYRVADALGDSTELVLVDDGSGPQAWDDLKALKAAHPDRPIVLLRLARNSGQHNATLCGLAHASGTVIVTMDADLQHPPEDLPLLLARLRGQGLDLVYGTALAGHGRARRIASRLFKLLTRRLGSPRIDGSSFRAMTASLARRLIADTQRPFTLIDSVLQEDAGRMEVVAVSHHPRRHGESSYTWRQLFTLGLQVVLGAPETPRLLLLLAAALALPGLGLLALWAAAPSFPGMDAARGLALVMGGMLLLYSRRRVVRWSAQTRLAPRYTLREKLE